jgi:hypothetical protein
MMTVSASAGPLLPDHLPSPLAVAMFADSPQMLNQIGGVPEKEFKEGLIAISSRLCFPCPTPIALNFRL